MQMYHRLAVLLNIYLLLWVVLFGVATPVQASDSAPEERKESITRVEKTSSNNIHVDEIVIKNSGTTGADSLSISEEEHKRLVSKLSNDAQDDFISWCKRQGLIIAIFGVVAIFAVLKLIWDSANKAITDSVEKLVKIEIERSNKLIDSAVSRLVDKQAEAIAATNKTIEATTNANNEIKKLEDAWNKIAALKDETQIIIDDQKYINIENQRIRDEQNTFNEELKSKTDSEIPVLVQKVDVLKRVLNVVDAAGEAKNQVSKKFIADLNSDHQETREKAAEILPWLNPESNEVSNAFIDILNDKNPDMAFRPILLSGLGKLKDHGKTLNYLLPLLNNLNDPDILAVIGALGELGEAGEIGENGNSKINQTESESIIDKLLSVLNSDLDSLDFPEEEDKPSSIRGAIALALSYYRKKASRTVADLIKLLDDKKPETRINAAIALSRIGDKTAIPALEKLIDSEETWNELKEEASKAIDEILKASALI